MPSPSGDAGSGDNGWVFVPCALCGSDDASSIPSATEFQISRCRRCGHIYTNPQLSDRRLHDLYRSGEFRSHPGTVAVMGQLAPDAEWHIWAERLRAARMAWVFRAVSPGARVLEIGCAYGDLLAALGVHGYNVYGIDLDETAAARAQELIGSGRVATVPLEEAKQFTDFDVIMFFELLEHIRFPTAFLQEVRRRLNPSGHVIIGLPNMDGLRFQLQMRLGKPVDLMGHMHLHHYSFRTLAHLLRQVGFQDVRQLWYQQPFIPRHRGNAARVRAFITSLIHYAIWRVSGQRHSLGPTLYVTAQRGG